MKPPPQPSIHLLGVNFRSAPVDVRESLNFTPTATAAFLRQFAEREPDLELLLLSTCNRTEFLLVDPAGGNQIDRLLGRIVEFRPSARILDTECLRYHLEEDAAINHLMRVACGLDSAILGDQQILGQLKTAKAVAGEAGTLGRQLEQLLIHALHAARRSRGETAIGRGAASIGAAVRETITTFDGAAPRILVIGAGETARDIGRHLAKSAAHKLTFINRTLANAQKLAKDCGGRAVEWGDISSELIACDAVVAAAACPRPILTHELLAKVDGPRPRLIVDAGVPRNAASDLPIPTVNIDAIHRQQETALTLRRAAVPDVERIIATEITSWQRWLSSRPVEAYIKRLFGDALRPFVGSDVPLNRETRRVLPASVRRELCLQARELRASVCLDTQ